MQLQRFVATAVAVLRAEFFNNKILQSVCNWRSGPFMLLMIDSSCFPQNCVPTAGRIRYPIPTQTTTLTSGGVQNAIRWSWSGWTVYVCVMLRNNTVWERYHTLSCFSLRHAFLVQVSQLSLITLCTCFSSARAAHAVRYIDTVALQVHMLDSYRGWTVKMKISFMTPPYSWKNCKKQAYWGGREGEGGERENLRDRKTTHQDCDQAAMKKRKRGSL